MAQRYRGVDSPGHIGMTVDALADERQTAVADNIGIRLFDFEALHRSLMGSGFECPHFTTGTLQ